MYLDWSIWHHTKNMFRHLKPKGCDRQIYWISIKFLWFIVVLLRRSIYVLNDGRAFWMYIQSIMSSNYLPADELTKDKTKTNPLQTSCFYYISWNTYSLQFSLKRCLAPCTMLKHAQILQYKCVRLKQCVIADTEAEYNEHVHLCPHRRFTLYQHLLDNHSVSLL